MGGVAAWVLSKIVSSRAVQVGIAVLAVAALAGGLYACGLDAGEDKADTKAAKEELKKIEAAREGADKVERRIDDKDDRALIECMRRNTC